MRTFDLKKECEKLYSKELVDYLTLIHEYKGKQQLYIDTEPQVLEKLVEIAKISSTVSSNRIEGIKTSDKRIKELLRNNSEPKNRSESEIKGYLGVLDTIHESYEYIIPRPNIILQLHKDLYKSIPTSFGGEYKSSDNKIIEIDENGVEKIRFEPLSTFETPFAMEELTNSYIDCINKESIDPLLLIPVFILDFLCIHPFNDGNGRMSRLLTLLLLYKSGYVVGKYISIESIIENTKNEYYEFLRQSSLHWITGENDYVPFVKYYLGTILQAYKDFEERTEYLKSNKKPKERIINVFDNIIGKISKAMIKEKCPDISIGIIEFNLKELLNEGYIEKVGNGRYTSYVKKQ